MNWIKEIREKTGLSQYKLAQYLGVSRSLIYFAEKGIRSLSTDALKKLMKLSKAWDEACEKIRSGNGISLSKAYEAAVQKKRQQAIVLYTRKLAAYTHELTLLQKRLEEMKKNYQQYVSQLEVTGTLFNDLADAPEEQREKLWLEIEQSETFKRFIVNGKANQLVLGVEINILLNRITMCENIIKEMTK